MAFACATETSFEFDKVASVPMFDPKTVSIQTCHPTRTWRVAAYEKRIEKPERNKIRVSENASHRVLRMGSSAKASNALQVCRQAIKKYF